MNRIDGDTRVIAVDTPNNNTLSPDWGTFRATVDAIEKATGMTCCPTYRRPCSG